MNNSIVIDTDSHILEPIDLWPNYIEDKDLLPLAPRFYEDESGEQQFMIEGFQPPRPKGTGLGGRNVGTKLQDTVASQRWEDQQPGGFQAAARLQDMDKEGVDIAMLYPTVGLRYTGIKDSRLAAAVCRAYNNWLADYRKMAPHRLIGIGAIPFQEPELAVKEMHYVVNELGFKGVFTRPNPLRDRNLDHPDYDLIWEAAQSLNCPVGIHEGGFMPGIAAIGHDRFENLVYRHMASHPMEQQLACMEIILGGVLERFPQLKVIFLESGGGWLPYWLERMDAHYERMGWMIPHCKLRPTEYFQRQCLIQVQSDESTTTMLSEIVGADHLCWGTDYPHFDCNWTAAVSRFQSSSLPETAIRKIMGENAARFFELDLSAMKTPEAALFQKVSQ
ncbi:MAG: hypothetical protein DCF15_07840 [Phormidesmis priestleyi]|uniref:Amidohydrolase-related domain-containing protein n=1 Tax=Phormidesmis priestleyi TaxID=268141 RepID=A0A2W4XI57_9CYAN|nr:MAG: hypothetical protein DCF15_07840 [Phormidesmis priestleyi]